MNTLNGFHFMENYPFIWELEADWLEVKVRWYIFIIINVCAGLPALVWSVKDLIHHRKNGHQISVFILLLLLTDFAELLLSPCILIKYLLNMWYTNWTNRVLLGLWWSLTVCGLLLNQLVALEGILSVKYPLYTASVLSSPCFKIFYILVFLCIIIGEMFFDSNDRYFFLVLFIFIVSVITWIISARASYSADHHSHTSRKPDRHILFVFIFNLLVIYLPYTVFSFFIYSSPLYRGLLPVFGIPIFLRSVSLISDPLLCMLVCRQSLRIQTSLKPEETEEVWEDELVLMS